MKYAIISDLHANLEALEAVLIDAKPRAEAIICLGDIVGYNANPHECLQLVQEVCTLVVAGNHDQAACDLRPYDDFSEFAQAAMEWTRKQLTAEEIHYLRRLPSTATFGKGWLAAHGSPRDTDEYLFQVEQFEASFAYLQMYTPEARVCFIGHTHIPMIWECTADGVVSLTEVNALTMILDPEKRYIVNPGSVGQPRYGDPAASYVILNEEAATVEFRFIVYNVSATQEKIYDAGLPTFLAERLAAGR